MANKQLTQAAVTPFAMPLEKRLAALNLMVDRLTRKHRKIANVYTTDTEVFIFLRPGKANKRLEGETCALECSAQGVTRWYEQVRRVNEVRVRIRWAVKDDLAVVSPDVLRRVH